MDDSGQYSVYLKFKNCGGCPKGENVSFVKKVHFNQASIRLRTLIFTPEDSKMENETKNCNLFGHQFRRYWS